MPPKMQTLPSRTIPRIIPPSILHRQYSTHSIIIPKRLALFPQPIPQLNTLRHSRILTLFIARNATIAHLNQAIQPRPARQRERLDLERCAWRQPWTCVPFDVDDDGVFCGFDERDAGRNAAGDLCDFFLGWLSWEAGVSVVEGRGRAGLHWCCLSCCTWEHHARRHHHTGHYTPEAHSRHIPKRQPRRPQRCHGRKRRGDCAWRRRRQR